MTRPDAARAWRRPPGGGWRLLAALLRCASGVSAVEFALVAPLLVVGAFSTADAGRAIYEKMMIGQTLRAGAQLAMAGADEDGIRAVLEAVASENFALADADAAQEDALRLAVGTYCVCPGESFAQIACIAVCDSGLGPSRFWRLSASKTFDGIMLPEFPISGTVDVLAE